SPEPEKIAVLCKELQLHLGTIGFQWFAACAVYPEVHWGLTLRLGSLLVAKAEEMERLLPSLARLVWMREAFIPDWLRAALLSRIDPDKAKEIGATLQKILGEANLNPGKGIALNIAVEKPHSRGSFLGLWQRVIERLRALTPAQLFRRSVQSA